MSMLLLCLLLTPPCAGPNAGPSTAVDDEALEQGQLGRCAFPSGGASPNTAEVRTDHDLSLTLGWSF